MKTFSLPILLSFLYVPSHVLCHAMYPTCPCYYSVLLSFCPVVYLLCCLSVMLSFYSVSVLLSFCPVIFLSYCLSVLLSICPIVFLICCLSVVVGFWVTYLSQHTHVSYHVSYVMLCALLAHIILLFFCPVFFLSYVMKCALLAHIVLLSF